MQPITNQPSKYSIGFVVVFFTLKANVFDFKPCSIIM